MTATTSSNRDAAAWLAFAACGAIWGSTFLVISIGNDTVPAVWAATLRLLLAGALLTGWTLARSRELPRGRALTTAAAYGACQFGINFPLLYWAERVIPSGLAAVVYATIPLSSAIMTRAFGMERLTVTKVAGALIAFGGVALLFSVSVSRSFSGQVQPLGLLAALLAATTAGLGTVLFKRGPQQDPIAANAVGSWVGAAITLPISFAIGEPHPLPTTFASALPILYLTIAGSLGAYVIMSWLVSRWPVSRTAYVTVIVPVIALGLGALVRDERLSGTSLAGAALVITGLVVGMRGHLRH